MLKVTIIAIRRNIRVFYELLNLKENTLFCPISFLFLLSLTEIVVVIFIRKATISREWLLPTKITMF